MAETQLDDAIVRRLQIPVTQAMDDEFRAYRRIGAFRTDADAGFALLRRGLEGVRQDKPQTTSQQS